MDPKQLLPDADEGDDAAEDMQIMMGGIPPCLRSWNGFLRSSAAMDGSLLRGTLPR
jgi:hypothetical protein